MTPEEQGRAAAEVALGQNPYDARTREGRAWVSGFRGVVGSVQGGEDVYVAAQSGVIHTSRGDMIIVKGVTRVSADHEVLRTHPQLFEKAVPHRIFDVEQMTAAPGERRNR